MAAVVDDISRPNTSNPTPKSKGTSRPLGFLIKYYSMLQNGMLADPSFLFKVGTEVGAYDSMMEDPKLASSRGLFCPLVCHWQKN
ncbi:hypothetical protein V6N11_048096 [Hibiscus sabdariffa]|uniref:Uncharacterized protein n=2 Tax=Hibiscus sabdariffa TaxID=183260 RepID=A0ABR2NRM2_9ROSI